MRFGRGRGLADPGQPISARRAGEGVERAPELGEVGTGKQRIDALEYPRQVAAVLGEERFEFGAPFVQPLSSSF